MTSRSASAVSSSEKRADLATRDDRAVVRVARRRASRAAAAAATGSAGAGRRARAPGRRAARPRAPAPRRARQRALDRRRPAGAAVEHEPRVVRARSPASAAPSWSACGVREDERVEPLDARLPAAARGSARRAARCRRAPRRRRAGSASRRPGRCRGTRPRARPGRRRRAPRRGARTTPTPTAASDRARRTAPPARRRDAPAAPRGAGRRHAARPRARRRPPARRQARPAPPRTAERGTWTATAASGVARRRARPTGRTTSSGAVSAVNGARERRRDLRGRGREHPEPHHRRDRRRGEQVRRQRGERDLLEVAAPSAAPSRASRRP